MAICDTPAKTAAGTAAKTATSAKSAAAGCKTVITKAQFDAMANNLAPNITPQLKKQLAAVLPRLMAMADEAKKQGLENTPQYKERVKFNRMQILAQELQQKMQEQAAKVPEADIEKYYKDHPEMYEQASVERVFVPRMKQIEPEKLQDEKETKAGDQQQKEAAEKAKQEDGEKAMTKLADDLRARAAAGEDFLKLQKEAFEAAGMKIESPTVTLPNIRRSGLPPAHAAVFDLKPGEVSQVISDSGGHYIYKVVSKNEMTLDQAKTEIQGKLQTERMKERDGQAEQFIQGGDQRSVFWAGWREPECAAAHAARVRECLRRQGRVRRKHSHRRRTRNNGQACSCTDGSFGKPGNAAPAAAGKVYGHWGGRKSSQDRLRTAIRKPRSGRGILYPDVVRIVARYARVFRHSSRVCD